MKYWGGQTPPPWLAEVAEERPRPLVSTTDPGITPAEGDIVVKPVLDSEAHRQRFHVETWETHDVLDGPFDHVRDAMSAALELGVTSRLAVWLDYSDDPGVHDLDPVPLYRSDATAGDSSSVA